MRVVTRVTNMYSTRRQDGVGLALHRDFLSAPLHYWDEIERLFSADFVPRSE